MKWLRKKWLWARLAFYPIDPIWEIGGQDEGLNKIVDELISLEATDGTRTG